MRDAAADAAQVGLGREGGEPSQVDIGNKAGQASKQENRKAVAVATKQQGEYRRQKKMQEVIWQMVS